MILEKQLIDLVGSDNVSRDLTTLDAYSGDMSFADRVRPAYVVKVKDSETIQKLVDLSRQTSTPIIPISSGPPHFRGDTVPGVEGAVIVDLSQMKRIIHIDRKNRVAMFEPGVTFEELSQAVAREGLRLNTPLMPRQSKSVLGSLLEREPVIMPKYHWDISDPLACTEIIFGNGEMFRTGAAAGSGTIEEQWAAGGAQKEAAGPSAVSWYRLIQGSQGTMGVVTWASTRCELVPVLEEPYFIGSSDLDKILEVTHWLIRLRLVNECLILNNTNLAMIQAGPNSHDYGQTRDKLPSWILFFNIAAYDYLPEERITGQVQDMLELAQKQGVEPVKSMGKLTAEEFLKVVRKPSAEPYWKLNYRGCFQDIFYLTVFNRINEQLRTMYQVADIAGYYGPDLGIYLQPIVQGVNCHCEFSLFYDPNDSGEVARVRKLTDDATRQLIGQGAFFSRPYGENASLIMNRDPATLDALRKIKSIVDPQNIMNPGKLGF